jgi:hypothetical protein
MTPAEEFRLLRKRLCLTGDALAKALHVSTGRIVATSTGNPPLRFPAGWGLYLKSHLPTRERVHCRSRCIKRASRSSYELKPRGVPQNTSDS